MSRSSRPSGSAAPSRSASAPRDLPLTGADCFLRAFDHEVRKKNGASHASQLILRLGPGFDTEAFGAAVDRAAAANPILHAPIRRPWGVGAPVYRIGRARPETTPPVRVHARSPRAGVPDEIQDEMNRPLDGRAGELVRFDVVRYDGGRAGTDVAMTWLHMLFDGAGSEVFLRWLQGCHEGVRSAEELALDDATPFPGMPEGLGGRERGARATAWQARMAELARPAVRSPAGPLRRVPQSLRYDVLTLDGDDAAAATARASTKAGFLTPMLHYLAAALRAHHAVFRARGLDPVSYLVPLPVNLRPKGSEEAIFRTRVSMIWFRVLPDQLEDFDALLAELKQQRRDAIKQGHVENGIIAMDYARFAPMALYARMTRRSMGGELCSFFFAFTGEFAGGLRSFFGAEVENGFHAPAVPPSPGSALALSTFAGRLNVTHVHQRGVFDTKELGLVREQLLSDLLATDG
jgi:hypothetical protein